MIDWLKLLQLPAKIFVVIFLTCAVVLWADARELIALRTIYPGAVAIVEVVGVFSGIFSAVSLLSAAWIRGSRAWIRWRLGKERTDLRRREALANVETLNALEMETLLGVLETGNQRFEVFFLNPAYRLVEKRILIRRHKLNQDTWLCDIDPAILGDREQIIALLRETLRRPDDAN